MALRMVSSLRMAATSGDFRRLAGGAEALVEGANDGVTARGDARRHVERRAHRGAAAPGDAWAAPRAAVAIERRDADQRGDLLARQAAQFRQLRQQRRGRGRADAGHRLQQVVLRAPHRTGLHRGRAARWWWPSAAARASRCASGRRAGPGRGDAPAGAVRRSASRPAAAGAPPARSAPGAPRRATGAARGGRARQTRASTAASQASVLARRPDRLREIAHLARIDDGDRQAGQRDRRRDIRFIPAGRLQHDQRRAPAAAGARPAHSARPHRARTAPPPVAGEVARSRCVLATSRPT